MTSRKTADRAWSFLLVPVLTMCLTVGAPAQPQQGALTLEEITTLLMLILIQKCPRKLINRVHTDGGSESNAAQGSGNLNTAYAVSERLINRTSFQVGIAHAPPNS